MNTRLLLVQRTAALFATVLLFTGCGGDEGELTCARGEVVVDGACVPDRNDRDSTRPPSTGGGEVDAGDRPGRPDGGGSPDDDDADGGLDDVDGSASDEDGTGDDGGPTLQPDACGPGQATTLSGVVRIPSGELPLPDVTVYIPTGELGDMETGARCIACGSELSGFPMTRTTTNIRGEFILRNIPPLDEVTLVIEVGNWRRISTVSGIVECEDNPVEPELTRLPRNQDEGHLPQFAVSTGAYDALECLLRKIGISDEEFTPETGPGRVHLFAGRGGTDRYSPALNGGASITPAWNWWGAVENLRRYDIIVHSCEGATHGGDKPFNAREALMQFTNEGGRVFLSHYHYFWMSDGPPDFQAIAQWDNFGSALSETETGYIDTSFEKGSQLAEWMEVTGTTPAGEFSISPVRGSIRSLDEDYAQRWVWIEPTCDPIIRQFFPALCSDDAELVQYFSFNTPVFDEPEEQCGRVVFSDIHVSAGDTSSPSTPFPNGCTTVGLTPQEKALVFMLFDLSRCIIPDKR